MTSACRPGTRARTRAPRRASAALLVIASSLWAFGAGRARAQEPAPELTRFFEAEVRPLLAQKCYKCHGPDKQEGGLRLDSRGAMLEGGDGGPAIVPGKPAESVLVEAVNYEGVEMPPDGKMADTQRATLARWVEVGAPWPAGDKPAAKKAKLTDEDRAFWSFRPVARQATPAVDDDGRGRNPIDAFIFAGISAAGLTPAPEADRPTLIRRLTFDLHGLPPAPEEVDAFIADTRPDAYERLVDRLLASPRYGQRWGRHWLDLVRYADSDGYNQDAFRPNAWRYRDYVVDAFNADRPYDRFVAEQLAGDEIDPADPTMKVAVGYLRMGTYEYNQRDIPGQWNTILNDVTDVTGDVFLGLGMACARCHDHKFDPILQRDYYRLRAFFEPMLPVQDAELADAAERRRHDARMAAWRAETAQIRGEMEAIERPVLEKRIFDAFAKFQPETKALLITPRAERSPADHQLAELAYRQMTYEYDHIADFMKTSKDKAAWDALRKRLAEHDAARPKPLPTALSVVDVGPEAPPTTIPGDRTKSPVEPGYLTLLDPSPASIPSVKPGARTTGRRSALASWITRPDNPLAGRVMVNRIWQYHFGRGLVGTSSDFGRKGDLPSHPALLDWLAGELVDRGWSLKAIHRLILGSATYRQSARHPSPEAGARVDPENRLLWRASTRRLEVEPIRDAMLAVSGELDPAIGGPPAPATSPRRTVDTRGMRNSPDAMLDRFDAPDPSTTTPQRNITVTPLQSLLMINGTWTLARASAFADRLKVAAPDAEGRVTLAYRRAFGRNPEPDERAEALAFLRDQPGGKAPDTPLVDFCHALLNSSEFLYVD
ncbi:PSD1 and planctomycete cytochrome C domain-containing protein [Isosphaeraceae bacterium EP7]